MTRRPLLLIVNPSAGAGRAARALPRVEAALRLAGHDLGVERTRDLAHAGELAATAVTDGRVAVAFGGDGLVGRVAGAVVAAGGVLGVLPGGRGNDFARVLGIPRDPVAACAVLTGGGVRSVDLAEVDGRAFLGIASLGFDSDVQTLANAVRVPLGQLVYLYAALRTLVSWRHAGFEVVCDGRLHRVRGFSVAVANSGVYGGGMRLAPDASLQDGLLDIVITGKASKLHFLRVLPRVFAGTHIHDASVTTDRAAVVEVRSDRPFSIYADGDPIGEAPATISVRSRALRVVVPPATSLLDGDH
ncbi:MAG: diacylglycerol/lipid kinase family protein [Mycobacteriales bacterium]